MGFNLDIFEDAELAADYIEWLVDEKSIDVQRHFTKLWEYYTNRILPEPVREAGRELGRCYVQAQEYGLPARITGLVHSGNAGVFGGQCVRDVQRKEVVIENDIAWRINATVDFLFGKPISFVSKSPDSQKRAEIESILKAVFAANGAIVPRQHAFGSLAWSRLVRESCRKSYSTTEAVLDGVLSPPVFIALMRYSSCWPRGWFINETSVPSAMPACCQLPNGLPSGCSRRSMM